MHLILNQHWAFFRPDNLLYFVHESHCLFFVVFFFPDFVLWSNTHRSTKLPIWCFSASFFFHFFWLQYPHCESQESLMFGTIQGVLSPQKTPTSWCYWSKFSTSSRFEYVSKCFYSDGTTLSWNRLQYGSCTTSCTTYDNYPSCTTYDNYLWKLTMVNV